jgi:hypothetical protein
MKGNCAPRHAVLNSWHSRGEFGRMLSGHPIYLKAKARGDNSMSEKRESPEGVYGAVLQDLRDTAKAGLPEAQFPAVEPHTRCHNALGQCRLEQVIRVSWSVPSAWRAMASEAIQGDEWAAYVALETFSTSGTRDGLPDASPKATESSY